MKFKIIFLSLISFNVFAFELPIVKVVDGDTISTKIMSMPRTLQDYKIRVVGIDTPEKGKLAKCEKEAALGLQATKFTKDFIGKEKVMNVDNCKHDKYGGRIDCDVFINGKSLSKALIDAKLAKPYDGGTKSSWCE